MNILTYLFISIEEALIDSWTSFPILLVLYFYLEWFGHYKGFDYFYKIKSKKLLAPILGALLGLIPQCGIGILMTGLYLRNLISLGTILAIYIATSDEALIVILSDIHNAEYIIPIIGIKFFTASLFGILVDYLFKSTKAEMKDKYIGINIPIHVKIEPNHSAGRHDWHPTHFKTLIWHALKHSVNIYLYIFGLSVIMIFIFQFVNIESVPLLLANHQFIEIVGSTIIGLIPNCIASVALAQAFLHSSLSFGAVIAGLSSAAGLGLIMLIKEAKLKTSMRILILLVTFSIILGSVINTIYPLRLPASHLMHIEHIH